MTNLTRLKLILFDLTGVTKKKTFETKYPFLLTKLSKIVYHGKSYSFRLILVDFSGVSKKKHLKQNILFYKTQICWF